MQGKGCSSLREDFSLPDESAEGIQIPNRFPNYTSRMSYICPCLMQSKASDSFPKCSDCCPFRSRKGLSAVLFHREHPPLKCPFHLRYIHHLCTAPVCRRSPNRSRPEVLRSFYRKRDRSAEYAGSLPPHLHSHNSFQLSLVHNTFLRSVRYCEHRR